MVPSNEQFRDHTELNELHYHTCFPLPVSLSTPNSTSSHQAPSPPRSILVNSNHPPQPVKSHTFPITSVGPRSKLTASTRECAGACPGPNVHKLREKSYSHRQRSQSPALGSFTRIRSRSTSSRARSPQSKGSTGETTRRDTSLTPTSTHRQNYLRPFMNHTPNSDTVHPQSKNSFNDIMGRVGGLVRSKSVSTGSKPKIELLVPEKDSGLKEDVDKSLDLPRRPSTSKSATRSRSSLSISRLGSLVSRTSTPTHLVRSRSTRSRLHSTRKDECLDDPNGTMVIDGVEFVNVISARPRLDAVAATERAVSTKGERAADKEDPQSVPIVGIDLATARPCRHSGPEQISSLMGKLDQQGTSVVSHMSTVPVMTAVASH